MWGHSVIFSVFKNRNVTVHIVLSVLVLLCSGSGLPANIQLDIDGDRETERIYSLFNLYMSKLEKMQGEATHGLGCCLTWLQVALGPGDSDTWSFLQR